VKEREGGEPVEWPTVGNVKLPKLVRRRSVWRSMGPTLHYAVRTYTPRIVGSDGGIFQGLLMSLAMTCHPRNWRAQGIWSARQFEVVSWCSTRIQERYETQSEKLLY